MRSESLPSFLTRMTLVSLVPASTWCSARIGLTTRSSAAAGAAPNPSTPTTTARATQKPNFIFMANST